MAFHNLDLVFTPESLAEDRQAAAQNFGLNGEDADSYIEKSIVDSTPDVRIPALEQTMNEPEKAQQLSQGIDAAAQDPKNQGVGIVPAIFAGIAGAFSDNGVEVATGLMDKWDPRTQEAQRVERQGKSQKVNQDKIEMDRTAEMRDAGSDKSIGITKDYELMFNDAGLPQLGSLFVGKSAEESDKLFESLSPQMQDAIGKGERSLDRDLKQQNVEATRENTQAYREATLGTKETARQDRLDKIKRDEQVKADEVALEKARYKSPGEKATDSAYAKDYNDWTTAGRGSYDKNMQNLSDALTELEQTDSDMFDATSGNIAGRLPDWMRSEKARVIQQKVQGAAMGALKATLGAQFTEKEGERIMAISYDPKLEPAENIKKINLAIQELVAQKEAQESKATYWEGNEGTLKGWSAGGDAGGLPEGTIQDNPNTGESRIMRNGNWEPYNG